MTSERIAELRLTQESLRSFSAAVEPPALLLLADDDSLSIRGNEAGLIRFALEILEVSAGGQVSPSAFEWIDAEWLPLESIVLDPNPQIEPHKTTLRGKLYAYGLLVIILGVWLVGMVVGIQWITHRIHF